MPLREAKPTPKGLIRGGHNPVDHQNLYMTFGGTNTNIGRIILTWEVMNYQLYLSITSIYAWIRRFKSLPLGLTWKWHYPPGLSKWSWTFKYPEFCKSRSKKSIELAKRQLLRPWKTCFLNLSPVFLDRVWWFYGSYIKFSMWKSGFWP